MRLAALFCLTLAGSTALYPQPSKLPPVKFSDTRLTNGLRVLISEDHYAPVFSIAVSYNVGSRDERKGRTGFAHLFEHMMFKGSENVGTGEHFFLVFNNGGNMNGTTNTDRTIYYETLPKNQLDLALFLESDRMRSLAITKDNLDNQRQAVQEERRLRLDNQPYGRSLERLDELAYDNPAYKHSVIGSMEDLSAATVDDVRDFFRIYYAPNNAVLALVGDLNTQETLAKVRKYFGEIPKQPAPPPVDLTEPEQKEERREKMDDKLARVAQLAYAYKIPSSDSADSIALGMLNRILAGGQSSRLYQKLVKEKELALQTMGGMDSRAGPSLYYLIAMVRPGKTFDEVEGLIDEEVSRIISSPVTAEELERARASARRQAVGGRESSMHRAMQLADGAVLYNDPNRINTMLDRQLAVTADDIQRVAKTYLRRANRSVMQTVPAAGGMRRPGPPAPKP